MLLVEAADFTPFVVCVDVFIVQGVEIIILSFVCGDFCRSRVEEKYWNQNLCIVQEYCLHHGNIYISIYMNAGLQKRNIKFISDFLLAQFNISNGVAQLKNVQFQFGDRTAIEKTIY